MTAKIECDYWYLVINSGDELSAGTLQQRWIRVLNDCLLGTFDLHKGIAAWDPLKLLILKTLSLILMGCTCLGNPIKCHSILPMCTISMGEGP